MGGHPYHGIAGRDYEPDEEELRVESGGAGLCTGVVVHGGGQRSDGGTRRDRDALQTGRLSATPRQDERERERERG